MIGGILLLPFLDRNPERHPRRRVIATVSGALLVLWAVAFTIWGAVS